MARQTLTPVILCGGSGTRLWPRSRPELPKPFLPLVGERTLFQEALLRCADPELFDPPLVVTGAAHVGLVEEQSSGVAIGEVIVEPEPRQTAAAVALAALRLHDNAVMLVCPSDHHMDGGEQFKAAAAAAARLAAEGLLVCLTIPASAPDTRFGYVRKGDPLGTAAFRVAQFVEKPDRERALAYVASGDFAWNAGIFAFRAGDYLRELERFRPRLADAVRRSVAAGTAVAGRFRPDEAAFAEIEPGSIMR
jgi:mannose-1-phosphate guanylyltransferase/mannose-1-phosphate guanylyltransferase/mannose-6-phosphate isomerase